MARRARKSLASLWGGSLQRAFRRGLKTVTRSALRAGQRAATDATRNALKTARAAAPQPARKPRAAVARPAGGSGAPPGQWSTNVSVGPSGARRYRLFVPSAGASGARLPLPVVVLLHGCDQDAAGFVRSTRFEALAAREGFMLLCPEQERLANAHGCWNWFDTRTGRAQAEASSIVAAIGQVCALDGGDAARVAVAGLSAGASMAALIALLHPARVQALVMHSGVGPGAAKSTAGAIAAMQGRRAPGALPPEGPGSVPGTGSAEGSVPAAATAALRPPLLVIQGLADPVVNARNGRAAAQRWAAAAGASAGPARPVQRGTRYAMAITDFKCGARLVATLCEVSGLGHAWSGGLARLPYGDAKGPDASRMVWAFALRQFKAAAG
jgi:poly(hydroxyalkanoate) depolymerase family esterase